MPTINKQSNTLRESNIELLRLLLMLMVVLVHIFGGKDKVFFNYPRTSLFISEVLIMSMSFSAVNTFFFISGYYGIKFKLRSFLNLVCQVLFYSLMCTLVFKLLGGSISIKEIPKIILPISSGLWWFISVYVVLYIIAPIMNKGLEELNKTSNTILVFTLLFLNTTAGYIFKNSYIGAYGYSLISAITVYTTARYVYKYKIQLKYPLLIFISCSLLCFAGNYLVSNLKNTTSLITLSNANPFFILSAAGLFLFFKGLKPFYNSFINKVAKFCLGVYLIHEQPFLKGGLHKFVSDITDYFNTSTTMVVLSLFLLSIIIFISSLFIDFLRDKLLTPLTQVLYTNINKRLKLD